MYSAEIVKLMIASPSDITTERQMIRDIIHEWNSVHSEDKNVVLMPVGWDTHAKPEMGDRPQELLNRQILAGCDCLVAVFWTRIGSPTGHSVSGTVEEIEEHIGAGKPAMVYFSNAPVRPDSVDDAQYKKLVGFRQRCERLGLIETYDTIEEFRKKFSRQLAKMIIREFSGGVSDQVGDSVGSQVEQEFQQTELVVASLTDDARQLLLAGSLTDDGTIMSLRTMGGLVIQVRGKGFTEQGKPRSEARWEAALQCLLELDLIKDQGYKGELFRLTNLGYQVADQFRRGVAGRQSDTTMQRRAWIEMNNGEDIRGSRLDDGEAHAVIEAYGGVRASSGDYRFPDRSMLMVRDGRVVASPDPPDSVNKATT